MLGEAAVGVGVIDQVSHGEWRRGDHTFDDASGDARDTVGLASVAPEGAARRGRPAVASDEPRRHSCR